MKRIDAIIRPSQLNFVREALDVLGYGGITVSEVKGHGKQRGVKNRSNPRVADDPQGHPGDVFIARVR